MKIAWFFLGHLQETMDLPFKKTEVSSISKQSIDPNEVASTAGNPTQTASEIPMKCPRWPLGPGTSRKL